MASTHPEVQAKIDNIRLKEEYLYNYPQRINDWLEQIQDTQLRPKLVGMVCQKLAEISSLEKSVQERYEQACGEANRLNVDLATLDNNQRDLARLRSWNEDLLKKITDINLKQEGQEVRTEIVQDPVAAAGSMWPDKRKVAFFALLAGLALGLAGVHVADSLDDRFRGVEEIESQLKVSVLAMVRRLETTQTTGIEAIAMHDASDVVGCEAFRTLRTALVLADREAESLSALKISVLGIVLNRLSQDDERGYYGYGYTYDYRGEPEDAAEKRPPTAGSEADITDRDEDLIDCHGNPIKA